ncbi:hypothetical protein RRG08_066538 [Elysia crispata]|uniref:Uncharacterized protein n=1 Tax=Elysia crispata TaxID=231223 RepID=A0AAE1DJ77_9GAST|nr:hypothetical protein RRG08_066538 [Elysia crispata]
MAAASTRPSQDAEQAAAVWRAGVNNLHTREPKLDSSARAWIAGQEPRNEREQSESIFEGRLWGFALQKVLRGKTSDPLITEHTAEGAKRKNE